MIKELTIFTNGDANKISTWSNVPYFFSETLIAKGIKVNRVDVRPAPLAEKIYNKVIRMINPKTTYSFFRSGLFQYMTRKKIRQAIARYPDADAYLSLSFSFSAAGLTDKPVILFGDWTYDYHIRFFQERTPDRQEEKGIKREDRHIEDVDIVFCLFPRVAQALKEKYRNPNIHYLGNVINSRIQLTDKDKLLESKKASNKLLFIGGQRYFQATELLIEAFRLVKKSYPELTLHLVGIKQEQLKDPSEDIFCYGYLDKEKPEDEETYYQLLRESKIFINPNPNWGAFSASLESLYFYTPVIVTPYSEFVATFGEKPLFGAYLDTQSKEKLAGLILSIMQSDSYENLCIEAHEAAKEHTWESYIDKFLNAL